MATKRQLINKKKKARSLDKNLVDVVNGDNEKEASKPKRIRRFCLTTYIDENAIYPYLNRLQWVQHYAFIMHDKDLYTKADEKKNPKHKAGTLKDKHTHILLYTFEAKTVSAVKKNFDNFSAEYYKDKVQEAQNTLVQECHDIVSQWCYLIHLDDIDKFQYDKQYIVCDDLSYWNTLDRTNGMTDHSKNYGLSILDDYLSGTDCYTMAQRYGKEWIYHIAHYQNAVRLMISEQNHQTFGGLAEICQFALSDSTYSEEQITLFFGMLSYIQNKMDDKEYLVETHKYLKA